MVRIQFSPPASRANSEFFPRAGCRRPISRAIRKHPETEHADYMERHGRVRWNEIAALIEAGPKCPKLQSYWHFDRYGYQKVERCCTEPDRWSVKALYRVSTEPTQLVSIWLTADRIRQGPLVRIHLPPAVSQQTFGSSQDHARCSTRCHRVHPDTGFRTPRRRGRTRSA